MAAYKDKKDLIAIGAYEAGSDPLVDQAIALRGPIDGFLRQHATDGSNANSADLALLQLAQAAPFGAEPAPGYAPPPGPAAAQSAIPPLNL
jgi:flagellum-specific ATP synthase